MTVPSTTPGQRGEMPKRYDFLVDAMGCIRKCSSPNGAPMDATEVIAAYLKSLKGKQNV